MIRANDDLPLPSPTARGLGIRPGIDIPVEPDGTVEYGFGGMSVAIGKPRNLPRHRRPAKFRGTGSDPVWKLDLDELPSRLIFRADDEKADVHGFLEPAETMSLHDYEDAIVDTRGMWQEC